MSTRWLSGPRFVLTRTIRGGAVRVPANLSRPAATVEWVSCVEVGPGLQRLLDVLRAEVSVRDGELEARPLGIAASYGWVYEHAGRVALTGAGAYHAGSFRRRGMLGR